MGKERNATGLVKGNISLRESNVCCQGIKRSVGNRGEKEGEEKEEEKYKI